MLCYRLIERLDRHPDVRGPILIELRGKNLRSLTPEEFLATRTHHYGIEIQTLLHLHRAGRLLLVFEGFDEIDQRGDTETRISHFRSLWGLNYPEAGLIVTGHPNFFLDSTEFRHTLDDKEQTRTLYLEPFDLDQIAHSLRALDPATREEILELARRDGKFLEVVVRPSLLHIVSVLWRKENLSRHTSISSALVIERFIDHSLKRQRVKQDERPFMVLNSAERHYFMASIAAHMAAKDLPNQIDGRQLQEAVDRLVTGIPDAVSGVWVRWRTKIPVRCATRNVSPGRPSGPKSCTPSIPNIRSYGLLVTDPSKDGAFKFAHKSHTEFLQDQTISRQFSLKSWNKSADIRRQYLEAGHRPYPIFGQHLWASLPSSCSKPCTSRGSPKARRSQKAYGTPWCWADSDLDRPSLISSRPSG